MRLDWDAEYVSNYNVETGVGSAHVEVYLNGVQIAALTPARQVDHYYSSSEKEVVTETVADAFMTILEGLG